MLTGTPWILGRECNARAAHALDLRIMSSRHSRRGPRGSQPNPPRPPKARAVKPGALILHGPREIGSAEARLLRRFGFVIAALLAIGLIAMVFGPHRIGDYFTETDFYGGYAVGARLLLSGRLDPSRFGVVGPGYEVMLAAAGLIVRDLFLAAQLLSVAATVLTLWFTFDLVSRRAGERVGVFAALFFATNAWVFRFGYIASTDAFSIALQMLALWCLLTRPGVRGALAAGAIAAAAFLTRYNALYLLPAGWIAIAIDRGGAAVPAPGESAPPRPTGAAKRAAMFTAAFALPVVIWVAWCVANGSHFSFQLHHNIAYEVYARHQGIVWDDYQKNLQPQFHNLWDVIRRDSPLFFTRMGLNLFDHVKLDAQQLLGWPVAIAATLGLLLAIAGGSFAPLAPLAIAGALLFLSLVPVFYAERYSLALMPLYATLTGLCFGLPRFALALRGRPVWVKSALAALPLAFSIVTSVGVEKRALALLPVEVLDAAHALRAMARPGDAVIARKPHLAYHAGLASVPFPFANTIPELAAYTHQNHVRWLFVSWPEVETRPRFWHLLDTTGVMPGLTPRHTTSPHPSVLYEVGPEFGSLPAWYSNDTLMTYHTCRAQLLVTPNLVDALVHLGMVMRARGQLDSARWYFSETLKWTPDNPTAMMLLGDVALQQKRVPEALSLFENASRLSPSSLDARVGLGWATIFDGRPEDAARIWRPLVQSAVDPSTLHRMVQLFHDVGDADGEHEALARWQSVMAKKAEK